MNNTNFTVYLDLLPEPNTQKPSAARFENANGRPAAHRRLRTHPIAMPLRPGPGPADTRPGPKPAPLHAKLPAELLGYCLSFSTRWAAVSCTQLVCRHWRLLCRGPRVALEPLIIVTLSGRSSLVVLDRGGRPRCSLPCAPWRARCRVRVWGERGSSGIS